ncbi:MAG: ABC transporter ATP-binding protein [Anaerovoracaceae bacterium]|jgi:ATP-binding cassette subfamily B multidrug efflux pump
MNNKNDLIREQQKRQTGRGGGPAGALVRPVVKAKDFKGTLKRLAYYLAPQKNKFIVVGILAIFSTVFSIIGPFVMGFGVTEIGRGLKSMARQEFNPQGGAGAYVDLNLIGKILLVLAVLYLAGSLFSYLMGYLMSTVAQTVVYNMRNDVKSKLDRLPLKYFDNNAYGDILSRITNDMDNISQTLQQSLTQFITSLITMVGVFIMMIIISPILTLVPLVALLLSIVVTITIAKRSQGYFIKQQRHLGLLSGHVEEMFGGHMIVKLFGGEEKSIEEFEKINQELYEAGWKAQFMTGLIMPSMHFINNASYVAICIFGGIMVARQTLSIGNVSAYIQYIRSFTQPIVQMANIANIIQSTIASAERVFDILDEEEEEKDREKETPSKYTSGEVVFEHIRFGYSEGKVLMEDVNISVKSGQTVAIVGPTGAGKTTLVNLLMRFYELQGGRITIDGMDIKSMKRSHLRSLFGMVLQDTWLFSGTIRENIAYSKLDATDEEVCKAAKAACADHFIRTLPGGYDTLLDEEAANISQGQKQLLTIARVILSEPAILILDEATSNVDTRTEHMIQQGMKEMMKGRTSFVIAHRLSTIKNADIILVMDKGAIIEKGTHHELLEQNGFYADLYRSQFTN